MTQQDNPSAGPPGAAGMSGSGDGGAIPGATAIKQFLVEPLIPADNGEFFAQVIRNAQHSVWLEVYLLTHAHVLDALAQAAIADATTGQKKDIRVILEQHAYPFSAPGPTTDASASPVTQGAAPASSGGVIHAVSSWLHSTFTGGSGHQMPSYDEVKQKLTSAGIAVQQNKTLLGSGGKTHAKIMIIDGQRAYIMTANLTTDSLGYATAGRGPQPAHNREYIVIDEDQQRVQTLIALFTADWDETAPRFNASQVQASALVVSPSQASQGNARERLLQLIQSAQQTLQIEVEEIHENTWNPPNRTIEQALVDAAARRVTVQVILPANPMSGKATTQPDIDFLKNGGVQMHTQNPSAPTMHAKMMLVDAQVVNGQVISGRAFVGSQNLTTAAFDHSREVGLLISDLSILRTLWQTFQYDWGNSQPM